MFSPRHQRADKDTAPQSCTRQEHAAAIQLALQKTVGSVNYTAVHSEPPPGLERNYKRRMVLPYAPADEAAVIDLWKLLRPPTVMAGFDGHRGWVNYLAVAPEHRQKGAGRGLAPARGCPKLNIQVRSTNAAALEFYRKIGYATDDVVSLGKRLILDTPY